MQPTNRVALLLLACVIVTAAFFHPGSHHPAIHEQSETRVLGHLDFPATTESKDARDAFIRGVLLLNLFEYATEPFQRAEHLYPGVAKACRGEAMTHNYRVHAPLGLEAARALAVMAPDAGRSLPVSSHIADLKSNQRKSRYRNSVRFMQSIFVQLESSKSASL